LKRKGKVNFTTLAVENSQKELLHLRKKGRDQQRKSGLGA
jgi:hypothetical protein